MDWILFRLGAGVKTKAFLQAASSRAEEYLSADFSRAMQDLYPCCSTLYVDRNSFTTVVVFGPICLAQRRNRSPFHCKYSWCSGGIWLSFVPVSYTHLAHEKGPDDLAAIDNPSPFSRVGPGPEYIIKPEISHYGCNAVVNKKGNLFTTGVTSFSKDGSLSKSVGTSFSTPRIASLATGLYQELDEDFDPLLLKGLIIHSASYSEKLLIPEKERTNQLGFGVPKSIPQILYNTPYEATLILRDTLAKGEKIDIMDFPMPKSCLLYTSRCV